MHKSPEVLDIFVILYIFIIIILVYDHVLLFMSIFRSEEKKKSVNFQCFPLFGPPYITYIMRIWKLSFYQSITGTKRKLITFDLLCD